MPHTKSIIVLCPNCDFEQKKHLHEIPWLSHIHKEGNNPCFIYPITYDCTTFTSITNVIYLLLAHWWFNSYAPKLVPIVYYRNKTQVQMFYFLSIIDGPGIPIIWFYLLKRSVKSPLMLCLQLTWAFTLNNQLKFTTRNIKPF